MKGIVSHAVGSATGLPFLIRFYLFHKLKQSRFIFRYKKNVPILDTSQYADG